MELKESEIAAIRRHKQWANGYSVMWLIIAFGVLGGQYWLFTIFEAPEADRACLMVITATLILVIAIWQAAGLSLARMEITLQRLAETS